MRGLLLGLLACHGGGGAAPAVLPEQVPARIDLPDLRDEVVREAVRARVRSAGLVDDPPAWTSDSGALAAASLELTDAALIGELQLWVPEGPVQLRWFGAGERRSNGVDLQRCALDGVVADCTLDGTLLTVPAAGPGVLHLRWTQQVPEVPPAMTSLPVRMTAEDLGLFVRWPSKGFTTLAWVLPQLLPGRAGALPVNGEHIHAALHDVELTVVTPGRQQVVGVGVQVAEGAWPDGRTWRRFAAPLVRETSLAVGSRWSQQAQVVDGVRLRVWSAGSAEVRTRLLDEAVAGWRLLTGALGPLPWREVDVLVAPGRIALGSEFTGFAVLHRVEPEPPSEVLAHELAHQWWYGAVGNDAQDHPWVDEAVTTWMGAWVTGELGTATRRQQILDVELPEGVVPAADRAASTYLLGDYAEAVYGRGGRFFEELARREGDAALLATLRRWHEAHAGDVVTGPAFQAFLEAELGPSVPAAWRQWMTPSQGAADVDDEGP